MSTYTNPAFYRDYVPSEPRYPPLPPYLLEQEARSHHDTLEARFPLHSDGRDRRGDRPVQVPSIGETHRPSAYFTVSQIASHPFIRDHQMKTLSEGASTSSMPIQPSDAYLEERLDVEDYPVDIPFITQESEADLATHQNTTPASTPAFIQQYVFHEGYNLQVNTHIRRRKIGGETAYARLTFDQKLVVVEHIHQVRPYTCRYIRQELARNLKLSAAEDLLSGHQDRIDSAVERIFPRQGRMKRTFEPWMTPFSDWDRKQVILKLAEATMQGADDLRDLFMEKRVESSVAAEILQAKTRKECRVIAQKHGLTVKLNGDERNLPWKRGASTMQRRALVQRMVIAADYDTPRRCYDLLKKKRVPLGYGVTMLKASDEDFRVIMSILETKDPLPTIRPYMRASLFFPE
ncbi:hypothetical protein CBS101457_000111 [Exobasidium rhododendri]|nr:hypothetical protein CBS101457_000111 [Exobasidium rhododendri]